MKIQFRLLPCLLFILLVATETKVSAQSLVTTDTIVLPVRWVSFQAFRKTDKVTLQWVTLHEQLTRKFIVERSNDGRKFIQMGSVDASTDSYSNASYKFDDLNPAEGLNFYRIRQLDANDNYSFSEIRRINYIPAGSTVRLLNSVVSNGTLNVRLNAHRQQPMKGVIYSNYGVMMNIRNLTDGSHRIDVSNLQTGSYYIQINNEVKNFVIL